MNKETYERLVIDVTQFDTEDIITTSGEQPVVNPHQSTAGRYELGNGFGTPFGF